MGFHLALWLLVLLALVDGHRCRRKSQHLGRRRTLRLQELVNKVRQETEDRVRAWCLRRVPVLNPDTTEQINNRKEETEKEIKQIPYMPPDLISKMRRVKTIDDFVREFKVKGMQKSYIKAPKTMLTSCVQSGRCNQGFGMTEKYTFMGTAESDNTRIDFHLDDTFCKPRTVIHSIPLPQLANFVYYPSCVEAQRCGGCCTDNINFLCSPQDIYLERRAVVQVFYNSTVMPTAVDIEHHRTCKCQCVYSQKDCLPTQTFDPRNCQCECKRKQSCGPDKQWSQGYCNCVCSRKAPCTKHQIWDTSVCRCMCPNDPCPPGFYRDRNTCECRV